MNAPLDTTKKLNDYAQAFFAEVSDYLSSIQQQELKKFEYKMVASEYSCIIGCWLTLGVRIHKWGTEFVPEIIVTKSELPWVNDAMRKRNSTFTLLEDPKDIVTINSEKVSLDTVDTCEAVAAAYFIFNNENTYRAVLAHVTFSLASDEEKSRKLLCSEAPFCDCDYEIFIATCKVLIRGDE